MEKALHDPREQAPVQQTKQVAARDKAGSRTGKVDRNAVVPAGPARASQQETCTIKLTLGCSRVPLVWCVGPHKA
jgi:hypothetical protein